MAKRAASSAFRTDSSSVALNEHLSNSAQQQLAGLRRSLESRLAALEEVLADPGRGESLAGLILDLSRIATEEAQVAASQVCIATRAEADKEMATFRASAKAALDAAQAALKTTQASLEQERALGADLRRAADQAQLENHKLADLLAAREQLEASLRGDRERLEAEVAQHQSIVADLQRAAGDLQREAADAKQQWEMERRSSADRQSLLEAELASGAALKRSAEAAAARLTTLERELEDERAAHEAAVADVTDERAAHRAVVAELEDERAAHRSVVAELEDQRTAHRAVVAELEDERAAHEAAVADVTDARVAHETVVADLTRERKAASERDGDYARLQSQLEAERAIVAELRQAAAVAEELSATLSREASRGDEAHEEAALLQSSLAEAREALASAQAALDIERASTAEIRQMAEFSDQQLASARSSEAQAVADYQKVAARLEAMINEREAVSDESAARKPTNQPRELEVAFAVPPPPPPPHIEAHLAKETHLAKARAKTHASAFSSEQVEPEDGWQAVRLASRYAFATELLVLVNGNPARLCDLSISGCQLLSPTALKPNQMVKIVFSDSTPVTCLGKVVWTRLEPMAVGEPLGYRAGVKFTKADAAAIEKFAARHATAA